MLIFAAKLGNMTDEQTKRLSVVRSFFKENLGFRDEEMVVVPLTLQQIENNNDVIKRADAKCLSEGESGQQLAKLVTKIYADQQLGIAKQILQVAVVEDEALLEYFWHQNYDFALAVTGTVK